MIDLQFFLSSSYWLVKHHRGQQRFVALKCRASLQIEFAPTSSRIFLLFDTCFWLLRSIAELASLFLRLSSLEKLNNKQSSVSKEPEGNDSLVAEQVAHLNLADPKCYF
ncbi:hypothetical protein AAHE18_10G242900 [Arachis hypogaea]